MSSSTLQTAGERIIQARTARNLTQAELARTAGITRQSLNQIERGLVLPRVDTALCISSALGCSLESLFDSARPHSPTRIPIHVTGRIPEEKARLDLAHLDGRWIAHESDFLSRMGAGLPAADGILCKGPAGLFAETHGELPELEENIFVAGCDPALSLLCDAASRKAARGRCIWIPCGSSTALKRLAKGEAHMAGIHFGEDDATNLSEIKRLGLSADCLVMRFSRWEQGWMLRKETGSHFRHLSDLPGRKMRLSNREKGSGCRKQLDEMLKKEGITPKKIAGYDLVATSHSECARQIAHHQADVGIGCESIARVFGLRFIPLTQIAFDLVIRRDLLQSPLVDALISLLTARRFAASMAEIPGYETRETGRILAS